MSRFLSSFVAAVVVVASASWLTEAVGRGQAPAQGSRVAAGPVVTAEQAAPFIGDWLVTVGMNTFEATFAVGVKADGGKVTATVRSDSQPPVNVTDISLAAKSLVLKYVADMQGTPISTVMTLTPDGANLRANMAVMDGQYQMSGAAAKPAPGRRCAPRVRRWRPRLPDQRGDRLLAEAAVYSAHAGRRGRRIHAARGIPCGDRCRRARSISPAVIEFDGNGRMYVAEMISYMMNAEATPAARADQPDQPMGEHKGDGRFDKRTVFADALSRRV